MRILLSDYSGHPFQVQLSRELARRGHEVLHLHFAGFQTPKGNLVRSPKDPETFDIAAVNTKSAFLKGKFARRRKQEIEVGHAMAAELRRFAPDVVISSNAPLDTQRIFQRAAREAGAGFVYWLQDIYSEAIARVVPRKLPVIGHAVAAYYSWLEFHMLRASDRVVAITADFVPVLGARGVSEDRIAVVENWAPLNELPLHPRDNDWADENMSGQGIRFVYSGTLGYKHDPSLLLSLAQRIPQAHVHVFSEGEAASALAADGLKRRVPNLSVHSWVAFADLPKMLSGADVFVAMIEAEAGAYSVPSKILTYLAVGRPILASVPHENLSSRLLAQNEAGVVAPPADRAAFLGEAVRLAGDVELRQRMGDNGRAYACGTFDINLIANRFETILAPLASKRCYPEGVSK